MKIPRKLLFLSYFLTNVAWAGYGAVEITEVTAGGAQQDGEIVSGVLLAPMVSIEPSGNGQLIFSRYSLSLSGVGTSRIFAQGISSSNQLQTPQLLVEHSAGYWAILPLALQTAENGNALLHYSARPDENSSIYQSWTIYYDAQSGWREPVQLHDNTDDVQIFIDRQGAAYATVERSTGGFDLYRYQSNNTWLLANEDFEGKEFRVGADNRFYRVFDGSTVDTNGKQYISFFDTISNQWQAPIALNEDAQGAALPSVAHVRVGEGGDIFTLSTSYDFTVTPYQVVFSIRKREANGGTWQSEPDVLRLESVSSLILNFVQSNKTDGEAAFMGLALISTNSSTGWATLHYNELTGWKPPETLLDTQNEPNDVTLMPIANNWFWGGSIWFDSYLITDNADHATAIICRNNCSDFYAKTYSASQGWSEELALPGLANDTEQGCGIERGNLAGFSPQVAVNASGQLIVASGVSATSGSGASTYHYYHATATGDILTATSNTNCVQPVQNPGTGNPGDNGGNPGTGGGVDEPSVDNIGDGAGAGGSFSLPMVFVLMLLFRKRFYFRFGNNLK